MTYVTELAQLIEVNLTYYNKYFQEEHKAAHSVF